LRSWLVLVVLVVGVASLSLGERNPLYGLVSNASDAVRGVTFSRPAAASRTVTSSVHADPALQARVEAAAALARGHIGAYVVDLEGGGAASLDPDSQFPAASLFKLPILVEVLAEIQRHELDPDRLLEVRQEDWTDGSGVLQARVGDHLSVRDLQRLMIQDSDNIAALMLLNAVGVDDVNATLERLGLRGTRVVDRRRGDQGENVTTARDMATLLSTIASGQLIDAETSEAALRLLELKQATTWLAGELPWWVKVAHKWGDLPEARHDAGIIFSPRGTLVAVVLTSGAQPDDAEHAIAQTARAAYDYLGSSERRTASASIVSR
jgi:beta-lactamase class A